MKIKQVALATAAIFAMAAPASAEQLVNGGFEAPTVGYYGTYAAGTASANAINGWTVTAGDVNTVNGFFPNGSSSQSNLAKSGLQYLDLVGESGAGSLAQTFATVAGQVYSLSFSYSHNLFSTPSASFNYALTNMSGATTGLFTHSTGSESNLDWRTANVLVTATGTSSTLTFTNLTGTTNGGAFLDAVSVTPVPEPASWAMMIAGFGLVGAFLRRRQRPLAFA